HPQGGERLATAVQVASIERATIDVGSCLGRAWDKMMGDLWTIVGISALVWLALSASHAVYVGIVITGPLLGGLYYYYLKKIRGQTAELQDAFAGFTLTFVQLLLASVVSGALIALGLALCVIPGIYLAVAWCFALPLIIDKQMSFWDAMELSRKTINQSWWSALWLVVVCGLINLGGGLLCCVGIFFTLPLTGLAIMYAYNDVFGAIPAKSA
ncbi:MAG TPA: glycerophosphoryl diester phosphodiesterase membrane domain-containing protein, partial [Verrucomicrobiae bacterium]|nr:glycerophosphoryl diester phosphodiesterase membrane domain-containing protein [Verrucomicrobiae bacterium]